MFGPGVSTNPSATNAMPAAAPALTMTGPLRRCRHYDGTGRVPGWWNRVASAVAEDRVAEAVEVRPARLVAHAAAEHLLARGREVHGQRRERRVHRDRELAAAAVDERVARVQDLHAARR